MSKTYLISYLFVFISFQNHSLQAQQSPIQFGEQFTFYSEILDETRTVNIYLPEYYHESSDDHTYPVIVLNDEHGDRFFHTTAGIVRHLSYVERMPEAIVVSFHDAISYGPDIYNNGMWGSREKLEFGNDPDLFIRHLREEFFPYLKSTYRAADFNILIGVSGSVIFPMHAFSRAPDLFQAHFLLAGADVVGMGYAQGHTFIDAFEQCLREHPYLKNNLYFGVADGDLTWQEEYVKNVDELKQRLLPYKSESFKVKIDVIPHEGHYDSYIKALLAGFELVFPKEKWSPKYRDLAKLDGNALSNIDAFYTSLSKEYGFAILPRADRWNNVNCLRFIGSRFLIDERTDEAIQVMQRWVQYRPNSPNAMNQLAKSYQINNQIDMAVATQQKAIELAKKYDTESVDKYKEQLMKFETGE